MFFKKRIINYNYLNNIQSDGSVIKSFDTISSGFISSSTIYLKLEIQVRIDKPFFLFINPFLDFFYYSIKSQYLNTFHNYFISIKIISNNILETYNSFLKTSFCSMLFYKKIKKNKKGYKSSKKIKKKEAPLVNMDYYIYNNLFVLKIIESYNKKKIYTIFFNI